MRIALQTAARGERARARDVRVGQFRPRRLREIERRDARECFAPALRGFLAQLAVDLLLGESFKLAVVVEQAHSEMTSRLRVAPARLPQTVGLVAAPGR